jgi:hypothetical protein
MLAGSSPTTAPFIVSPQETGKSKLENHQSPIANHQWLDGPMSR